MIPLTDERLRQLAYDDMVCINDSGRAMAVELIAARARIAQLGGALADEKAGRRVAGEAADRFRDVVSEVLGLDENPGDDELVRQLRALHGKTGPEPRRWRDFITGAIAHVERNGGRWLSDFAATEETPNA